EDAGWASGGVLESAVVVVSASVVWAALIGAQRLPRVGRCLLAGAAIGVFCLAYPAATPLLLIVPVWLWLRERRPGRALAAAGAGVLCVLPATIHNYRASGEFFLVRAGSGIVLAQGNQPGAARVVRPGR